MTIQELGSIGEFIAALATIATLLYLALQIRQSTAVAPSAATQEGLNSHRELVRELLTLNPEVERLYAKLFIPSRETEEKRRFHLVMVDFLLQA